MPDKDSGQSALGVEGNFKGKNAEHEVEVAGHFRNTATIPSPDLRADVVDNHHFGEPPLDCLSDAQIESWIINQNERIWLYHSDFCENPIELRAKIRIFF